MGNQKKNSNKPRKVDTSNLNIISCNVRGLLSKKKSIENILIDNDVDICVLSELNTKNLPDFKGYTSFTKYVNKAFHGISILVSNSLAKHVIRIPDSSELEIVHVRIENTIPALNIIGTYLPVETRMKVEKTDELWKLLTDKVDSLINNFEAVCVIGDLNRPLQNQKPSHGTTLLNDWLNEENMRLLNKNEPTRVDPATGKGSILDLAIVSDNIFHNVKSFHVDNRKSMTPFSIRKNKDGISTKFTDHFTINLKLDLPCLAKQGKNKKIPFINYHNKEGWKRYEKMSNKYAQSMMDTIKEEDNINMLDIKLQTIDEQIQISAFGLKWVGPPKRKGKVKKRESKEIKEMFQEQQEELGMMIQEGIIGKDLNKKMYNLKNLITGPKVKKQEQMAINDPITNKLITDKEEIKNVSLQHNIKILTKDKCLPEDEELVREKKERHEEMMKKNDEEEEWELDYEMFCKVTDKIKSKNKNMYKLLNKSGAAYRIAIFEYMKKVIKCEDIPQRYKATTLIQIWKGKGSPLSLNNMRFIHMRGWKPKLLEALVTEKMKPKIVEATPKFQLGGMPGASSVEHLVVLKTWMKSIEQYKRSGIFTVYDMKKFFDREGLLDCMDTLNVTAGIDAKSYRLWYKLNEDTDIAVKTSVGLSRTARIKDSIGQGSVGAALVSSLNIGAALNVTFKNEHTTKIGHVGLNSLIFQDDIGKLNDNLQQARDGCHKIHRTLQSKQLSLNNDKSKYMIFGSSKFRNKALKELKENPMTMGSGFIDHSPAEKYLGDIISEKGCQDSITETIKERVRKLRSKCDDIIQIAEAPLMSGLNKGSIAFKLFDAQIIPCLLHNSESWIGMTKKHLEVLQKFQDKFIRKVLRIPLSTPKAIMQYDTGLWPMEWRIKYRKLNFVRKTMLKPDSNIAKKVLHNEMLSNINGLARECLTTCVDLKIDFLLNCDVPKFVIKQAIIKRIHLDNRRAMETTKKVADRLSDDPSVNSYLDTMGLTHCRLWFRYRARCIAGVKANAKRSYVDLACRFCTTGSTENQEHLEVCEGFRFERRGLHLDSLWGKKEFWRRSCVRLATVTGDSSSGG